MTLSFTNNKGYIFIVRRLGKQSKLILSRSDSISNLELNLKYMAHVAQMLTQEPIYKLSSIFCFKPILLSAHKLILLIYGDNRTRLLKHVVEQATTASRGTSRSFAVRGGSEGLLGVLCLPRPMLVRWDRLLSPPPPDSVFWRERWA